MPPSRRRVLAAIGTSIALAGCSGGNGGGGGDGDDGGDGSDGGDGDGGDGGDTPTDTTTTGDGMGGAAVGVRSHPDLGDVLVGPDGRTLYMFDQDDQGSGSSSCSGDCASAWPPLTVDGSPAAGDGVEASLSTFERENGDTQVAANGWPLYYFASDSEPGDVKGQGVGGVWWVLRPDGTPVRDTGTTTEPDEAVVQVRSHPDLGDILVGPEDMTLYLFDQDERGSGSSRCTGDCASAWPPLTVDGSPTAGDGVEASLSTFERENGDTQVAINGWPLYYFASDSAPGDVKGQGVGNIWWVLRPDGTGVREGEMTTTESGGETTTTESPY